MRRWRGTLIATGLVAAAAAGVVAVMLMPSKPRPLRSIDIPPVNVRVMRVKAVPEVADTLVLTGVVEPEAVVKVAAEVFGRIERRGTRSAASEGQDAADSPAKLLEEGQPISRGDPIYHLNRDLLEARYERARAQFEYDEREFRRIQDLFERGSTSKTELDDARTRRDMSRAALSEIARELERTTIVAPVSGILNRFLMEVGEYASPGDPVAEIVQMETAKVVVDVPERDVSYLRLGQPAYIVSLPSAGRAGANRSEENELVGSITFIDALADQGTRTTRVEISIDNRGQRLHSGQIVRARLTRRVLADVILIPLSSVIPLERGHIVYVVNEGHAEQREVELGLIRGRQVQVVRGLTEGDCLIVAGHHYVGPGQSVTIVAEQQATDAD